MRFDNRASLTRRLEFVSEALEEFRDKYYHQVLGGRALSYKWRSEKRDLQVGDVVYMSEQTDAGTTYRLACVSEVKRGADNHVRSAVLRYRLANEQVFRHTERPITKMALIVPNDYKFEDEVALSDSGEGPLAIESGSATATDSSGLGVVDIPRT